MLLRFLSSRKWKRTYSRFRATGRWDIAFVSSALLMGVVEHLAAQEKELLQVDRHSLHNLSDERVG
jgi:hypothetical protein